MATLLEGVNRENMASRLRACSSLRQPRADALLQASIKMGKVLDSDQADSLPKSDEAQMKSRDWIWNYREFFIHIIC